MIESNKVVSNKAITKIISALNKPFEKSEMKYRDGKNGEQYAYIPITTLIKRLNNIWREFEEDFIWNWNIIDYRLIDKVEYNNYRKRDEERTYVSLHGRLTVKICKEFEITYDGIGGNNTDCGNFGDNVKSAESDALKKAISKLGIGLHAYDTGGGGSKKNFGNKFDD